MGPQSASEADLAGDHIKPVCVLRPSYQFVIPSAPWPWFDIRDEVGMEQLRTDVAPAPGDCDHTRCQGGCWKGYPQSRFPNWTSCQVKKCKLKEAIEDYNRAVMCTIYQLDVDGVGKFRNGEKLEMVDERASLDVEWNWFKDYKQGNNVCVRALFVENMSGPVLQMLGGKHNIQPFFFASSLNWISSHFQADLRPGIGDHITFTLPFIQSLPGSTTPQQAIQARHYRAGRESLVIDTEVPLILESNHRILSLDLLSVYLVRNVAGNTIISFHPNNGLPTTKAYSLHERIRFSGQSAYWQKILEQTADPTFLFLIFFWYAMYAWDRALRDMYEHIGVLETEVIKTSSMGLTEELYIIRTHILHYSSLLDSFKKIIHFVLETPNPALTYDRRANAEALLEKECNTLLSEIDRLHGECTMQERRVKNVMDFVFSSVNIFDSKTMQKDSAAMKQIAYLTTVFMPASFVASVFGMNVHEIVPGTYGSLINYFAVACSLTMATVWIIIAIQSKPDQNGSVWRGLGWPIYLIYRLYKRARGPAQFGEKRIDVGKDPVCGLV